MAEHFYRGIFQKGRGAASGLPQARVVLGKHAPEWSESLLRGPLAQPSAVTYKRVSPEWSATALSVLNGFWPVVVIVSMGLALLWGGALANSP